jgi:hypothetical protein
VDKLVDRIASEYQLELDGLMKYFTEKYSLSQTSYVITLRECAELMLDYVQDLIDKRKSTSLDGVASRPKPFHKKSQSMTIQTLKDYLYA